MSIMSTASEAVEVYSSRRELFRSIDIRIAAVKHEDVWYNLRAVVLLSCDKVTNVTQRVVDVDNFMILCENVSAESFPALLDTIDRDEFEIDGIKIKFFAEQQHQLSRDWYLSRKSSDLAHEQWNMDWPLDGFRWEVSHKLRNDISRILDNVSRRLRCNDPPYEDVYKAVREILGLQEYALRDYDGGQYSVCFVLLPDYLAIKSCRLQGNRLVYEVKMHSSINPSNLRLGIIAGGKTIERYQKTFNRNQIRKSGTFKLGKGNMKLRDIADAQLYAFLKGRESQGPSDTKYIRNLKIMANPRFLANSIFGADAEKLTIWLHGNGKQGSDDFEHAVAILFHLCGFSTEWLDRGNLAKDAPDVLIFSSEPRALIVGECKVDVFDWKDIRKLRERANRVFQEVGIDTYPTMFTSVKQDDVDMQTREKARNERITILASEEIDEILKMALRGSKPSDVLSRYFQQGLTHSLK